MSTETGSPHGVQAERGGSWRRGGESVCYYENHYESDSKSQLCERPRTARTAQHSVRTARVLLGTHSRSRSHSLTTATLCTRESLALRSDVQRSGASLLQVGMCKWDWG